MPICYNNYNKKVKNIFIINCKSANICIYIYIYIIYNTLRIDYILNELIYYRLNYFFLRGRYFENMPKCMKEKQTVARENCGPVVVTGSIHAGAARKKTLLQLKE